MILHKDASSTVTASTKTQELKRRDYLAIPLLILLTIFFLFAGAEVTARVLWPEQTQNSCLYKDPAGGYRAKPNCTERLKNVEGPWVTYHYNGCGYRGYDSCGPKRSGTFRIAAVGSSTTQGLNIPYEQTFGVTTAQILSNKMSTRVEVQNLGVEDLSPLDCYRRLNEVINLNPDMIVYVVTPYDIQKKIDPSQLAERNNPGAKFSQPAAARIPVGLPKRIQRMFNSSRAVLIAQHFLFTDIHTYFRLHVRYGDKSNLFQEPLTQEWKARLADFEVVVKDMGARSQAAQIPFIIMAVPSRSEAALLSGDETLPNTDPFAFGRLIGKIAQDSGVIYADVLYEFSRTPHSEDLFFPVDLHLDGDGQQLISRALIRKCLDRSIPRITHLMAAQN